MVNGGALFFTRFGSRMWAMQRSADGQYELILENRQVLTIFFVVVVLCGVFFGLGYIVGKNTMGYMPPAEAAAPSGARKSASPPAPGAAEQPSPASGADTAQNPQEASAASDASATPAAADGKPSRSEPAGAAQVKPVSTASAPASSGVAGGESVSLQVAALSKKEDADSLLSTLKKRGFPATLITSPADRLFRVQIGPFSSTAEVEEMKARLEREGFKAITKR